MAWLMKKMGLAKEEGPCPDELDEGLGDIETRSSDPAVFMVKQVGCKAVHGGGAAD